MQRSHILALVIGLFALLVIGNSFFIIQQGEQALVLQFGQWRRTVQTPGMHAKVPFFEDIMIFEKRVLAIEPAGQQVTLGDKTRLEVDSYARYRITDPRRFYQALQNEQAGRIRLSNIVNSSLSEILARYTLADMLSKKRVEILNSLRDRVRSQAEGTGVEIVDVRIRRADLPDETSTPIYARMISERQREAAQARAEGQEVSARIKSEAERDRIAILSEAQRDADITRGAGDREALETVAKATSRNPEFYAFYRSLEAYRVSMGHTEGGPETTFVLSPDSPFLRYFSQSPRVR
jgi:modulator of FtsH protease HflC